MGEMLGYFWRSVDDKARLFLYMALALLLSAIEVVIPLLTGFVINLLVAGEGLGRVAFWSATIAVLGVAAGLAQYGIAMLYTKLHFDASFALTSRTLRRMQRFPADFFKDFDAGYYSKRVNGDSEELSIFFLWTGNQALANATTSVLVLVLMFRANAWLAILCAMLAAVVVLSYTLTSKEIYRRSMAFKEAEAQEMSMLLHQLSDVAFIRRHVLFDRYAQTLERAYGVTRTCVYRTNRLGGAVDGGVEATKTALLAVVILVSAQQVAAGALEVGFIATAVGYFNALAQAASFFSDFGTQYQGCRASFERLRKLADAPLEKNGPGKAAPDVRAITCHDLSFTYPGNEEPTLRGLDMSFSGRGLYGLVGGNGSGKSTLLKLVSGEWSDFYGGDIRYDDAELREMDHYDLREHLVGYVEQEPGVIEGSLWDNLTLLCDVQPPRERVMELCGRLGLGRLVDESPKGLDTMVDGTHASLSGGEKQKVAIIRMLLEDPKVMLMDEPSSALDAKSIDSLVGILGQLKKDHLILLVSHDDRLIDACDHVIRL
ncbi:MULTISPECIES: ABC transporter ATP-binding protein [Olsenella]|uniref:ABC transporter ATP-binding protein n=1 Tax=Olsenella TaxID=133925 RepID=UPI000231ECA8|nr:MULTISPECIES: ABC transporter ATP-binding protein [Olsenella]EHF02956.1 hypothetical protein HMPREF1008_00601 [Olsenella sp. oral taxon 809 str. F0356]KXB61721.1 ABC transporter, ATP-binding protein [Olsenella sp. DNF00959]